MLVKKIVSKQNRALLRELVATDFKLRYQGSVLGYTWSLLRPLLLFLIMYEVFVNFLNLGKGIAHYPVYLLLGIVLWNFFSEMTSQSLSSVVTRGDLIRKIRIPRWIIVLSSSVSALINLALNLIVVGIFIISSGVNVGFSAVWFVVILAEVYVFALGISLFLAAAFVKYRDISHIWEVIMQALFYLTPIIYPIGLITNMVLQKWMFLNPMAQAIQDARNVLITTDTTTIAETFHNPLMRLVPMGIALAALLIGTLYFKKEAKYFAENI